MKKPRCKSCKFYCYDYKSDSFELGSFFGLPGRVKIDLNKLQLNLDGKGECGYHLINLTLQLFLF